MTDNRIHEVEKLDTEINRLISQRDILLEELKQETAKKYLERAKSWNLKSNACMILFSKNILGNHWNIAKTLFVTDVDFTHNYFDAIETCYREYDSEYIVRVEETRIYFADLENIEDQFNIYFVDEVQMTLLQQHFLRLRLDYQNYKTYEETFAKEATMSIKIK